MRRPAQQQPPPPPKAKINRDALKQANTLYRTLAYDKVPEFMQDNNFIRGGYRPVSSVKASFMSLLQFHNESMNIWTHGIGGLIFTALMINSVFFEFGDKSWGLRSMFLVFTLSAQACLFSSMLLHWFCCVSARAHFMLCQLDYCCINLLITGSCFPVVYNVWYCAPFYRDLYLVLIMVFAIPMFIAPWFPRYHSPAFRPFRALSFWMLGVCVSIPVLHFLFFSSYDTQLVLEVYHRGVQPTLVMALLYGLGTLIYVLRVPERFAPGKFDIFFTSHQIFHVFVVAAALTHYFAQVNFAHWRDGYGCPNSVVTP